MLLKDKDVRPAQYAKGLAQGKSKMQAALDAGYTFNRARKPEERIERLPNVRRALLRYFNRAELSAERTLEQVRRIAFMDVRSYFDEAGNLKPLSSLTEEQAAAIRNFEVIKKNAVAGDGKVDTIHKVQFHNAMDALQVLAQHFHLVDETVKVDQDVQITVSWQQPEAAITESDTVIDAAIIKHIEE